MNALMKTPLIASFTFALLVSGCAHEDEIAPRTEASAISQPSGPVPMGRVGSHGMILAGTPEHAFLSHIPMFGPTHDVQLVYSAKISTDGPALPSTLDDRLYTVLPDRMSLDALRLGALTELKGTLYLGSFEQGGRPLTRVAISVQKVIYQAILDAATPAPADPTYLFFGTGGAAYAVHRISNAPGSDQVLRVKLTGLELAEDVVVTASAPGVARLGKSEVVSFSTGTTSFDVEPVTELSCLVGPGFFENCE